MKVNINQLKKAIEVLRQKMPQTAMESSKCFCGWCEIYDDVEPSTETLSQLAKNELCHSRPNIVHIGFIAFRYGLADFGASNESFLDHNDFKVIA